MDFIEKCGISLVEPSPQISAVPSNEKLNESGSSDNKTDSSGNTLLLILIVVLITAAAVAVILLLRKRTHLPEEPLVSATTIPNSGIDAPKEASSPTPLSHDVDPLPTERWSEEINTSETIREKSFSNAFHEPDEL